MRSRLLPNSFITHAIAVAFGILIGLVGLPIWRTAIMAANQEEYGALVEKCDNAMRDHFQAKRDMSLGQKISRSDVEMGEIGLVICQDYDMFQKRLQRLGLRENELAEMRLTAIEARGKDLEEIIETHEIRY